ncbi:laccase, partial [Xanthomonas vasicola pv. vasculorum NCPPB 895]|uniref:peptidoglycan editing factor PgeF n=1 Tax=Xanthomonas vasicola TaxID=56459 RepID=UPI0004D41528
CYWLRQVHGVGVVRVDAPPAAPGSTDGAANELPGAQEPVADAAVTSVPGVVLAILTADCLPVVFAAVDGNEVAAAHAGWRGLADGVLERSMAAMRTPPQQLVAWLGPAAGPRVYEIGQDVFDAFVAHDAQAQQAFVATRPGHWRVDLYALARQRLQQAGVPADAVYGGGLCTISDPQRFFSHRRDRRSGRMATLAWIAP